MLLQRVDERVELTRAAAAVLSGTRDPGRIVHAMRELLAQRIYGLCCGYEDLNDHDRLREDVLMQTALGRVDALVSRPRGAVMETPATQARLEAIVSMARPALAEQYAASGSELACACAAQLSAIA